MKKIVILGSGAGGTICANKLRKELSPSEWQITIIDKDEMHHYQPGWLFIPFGIYTAEDCMKPKREFIPKGVNFILDEVVNVDPDARKVVCQKGKYSYDWLIIASGCRIAANEVEGLEEWTPDPKQNVHTFFTLESAVALRKKMKYFRGGKVVFNIAEMPHKCPVVPIEFIFMLDWYARELGVREKTEIEFITPNTGIFTKPIATNVLGTAAVEKGIKVTTDFHLSSVDTEKGVMESASGGSAEFDLLISTMPNLGAEYVEESEMGDGMGYVLTNNHTLQAEKWERIYVVGDATNVPTSKAGSVAHYEAEIIVENILLEIDGQEPKPGFDGHSTCFIVSGFDKAYLIDFNYKTEPLPGKYPFPGLGPFELVGESYINYWGKMMFKWVYWNLLLPGEDLPLEPQMTMAGKTWPKVEVE